MGQWSCDTAQWLWPNLCSVLMLKRYPNLQPKHHFFGKTLHSMLLVDTSITSPCSTVPPQVQFHTECPFCSRDINSFFEGGAASALFAVEPWSAVLAWNLGDLPRIFVICFGFGHCLSHLSLSYISGIVNSWIFQNIVTMLTLSSMWLAFFMLLPYHQISFQVFIWENFKPAKKN